MRVSGNTEHKKRKEKNTMNPTQVNDAMQFAQAFYKFEHENAQKPEYLPSVLQVPMEDWLQNFQWGYTNEIRIYEDYNPIPHQQLVAANKMAAKFGHGWSFKEGFLESYNKPVSEKAITLIANLLDTVGMGIHAPNIGEDGNITHSTGTGRLNWSVDVNGSVTVNVKRPLIEWSDENGLNHGERIITAHWNGTDWTIQPLIPNRIEMRHIKALHKAIQAMSVDGWSIIAQTFKDFDAFFSIEKVIDFLNKSDICKKVSLVLTKSDKPTILDAFFPSKEGFSIAEISYTYWLDSQPICVTIHHYGEIVIQYPIDHGAVVYSLESHCMSMLTKISPEDSTAIKEAEEKEKGRSTYRPDRRDRSERMAQ